MRAPGEILLVACYELGHQPLAVAWPAAFLERAGYAPAVLDLSVEPFDAEKVRRARLVVDLGPHAHGPAARRCGRRACRALNPACHVCFYGLYASLNHAHLLAHGADSVLGGEAESALVQLRAGWRRRRRAVLVRWRAWARTAGDGSSLSSTFPSRAARAPLAEEVRSLERDGRRELAGYVEASRGCLHHCRHCPIPPVYGGRFFVVPRDVVLADVRQQVEAGATHITFGDPDFLNGPGHALAVARALHAEFPPLTFDVTAKVEHLQRHRDRSRSWRRSAAPSSSRRWSRSATPCSASRQRSHPRRPRGRLRASASGGIALRPTWVAFTPWTTLADFRELLDFIEVEGLVDAVDPVQLSIRLLVPRARSWPKSGDATLPGGPGARDFPTAGRIPTPGWRDSRARSPPSSQTRPRRGEDAPADVRPHSAPADAAAGARPAPATPPPSPGRPRPPRLTEPWFC